MEKAAAGSKRCGSRRSLSARWPRSTIRQNTKRFTRPTRTTSFIATTRITSQVCSRSSIRCFGRHGFPGAGIFSPASFFQNWDPARHVKSFGQCVFESWQPRWISIDWGFEHSTVVLWWTRVRIKTDLDQTAERTVLLCYRQLVVRQMNEQLAAERIAAANYTGDKSDPIQHIYLSPDRFSKIDQHHSIADKMGDIFVQYDLPRPERANNRRVDGWRLCYTLLDTDGLAVLDNCVDVIDSIPKLMRDEKNVEDAQKEGNELFLDVCESFRYGVMSYGSEQATP